MSVDAGTVLKSEVCFRFEPDRATGTITVAYRSHRGLGLWLPSEMKEKYEDVGGTTRPVFGGATKATARYSNYRRFTVEVVEKAEW